MISSACVLPLDIHAIARDSSKPIGIAATASRKATRMSYPGAPCRDMISKNYGHNNRASFGYCLDFAKVETLKLARELTS